jgi:nucleotide-binding universal stress UspA family protein
MTAFNRTMMACDLSDMDKHMLRFLKTIREALNIKKLYFIHIMPDVALPQNADLEFHKLFSSEYPVDEKIEDKIKLDIEEVMGSEHDLDFDIEVVEGQPYQKLIHWADVKEVGLLVVGRKKDSQGSGITARRVARHAKPNILFVPEDANEEVTRILVPIDYSDNSARAMRTALNIQGRSEAEVKVIGIHIIDMPPADYYMRPVEHTGFVQMLEDSAKKAYNNFMEAHAFSSAQVEPVFIDNMYNNTAAHLNDYAMDENIDLIIMGAQGHSAFNSFLFGSVTEKLVNQIEKPVLIIR